MIDPSRPGCNEKCLKNAKCPTDRFAVILGTNEIASAVAVGLHRAGYGVVLSHDPLPPVIRRKMAFHDALFDDAVSVDGMAARRVDTGLDIRAAARRSTASPSPSSDCSI